MYLRCNLLQACPSAIPGCQCSQDSRSPPQHSPEPVLCVRRFPSIVHTEDSVSAVLQKTCKPTSKKMHACYKKECNKQGNGMKIEILLQCWFASDRTIEESFPIHYKWSDATEHRVGNGSLNQLTCSLFLLLFAWRSRNSATNSLLQRSSSDRTLADVTCSETPLMCSSVILMVSVNACKQGKAIYTNQDIICSSEKN